MSCPLFPPWLGVAVGVVDNAPLRDSLPYAVSPHVVFAGPSVVGSNGVWSKRPMNETLSVTAAVGKPPIVEGIPAAWRSERNLDAESDETPACRRRSPSADASDVTPALRRPALKTHVVIPFVFDQFTVGAEAQIARR